ncbi:MAG: LytTR family DNA-binding domain-containing protein [Flavobacteriales bacterium]|nr:LytTR family DNA-binding domain-containing protein [Flavobacteriales bacterium]
MIKTLIVDDERNAQIILENYLRQYCPDVEVVSVANSVKEAVMLIKQYKPELVFLDIQMNDGTGFDVLNFFPNRDFQVVFSTAYDQYAIKAFKYSAQDYILKPLDIDEVVGAVERIKAYIQILDSTSGKPSEKPEQLQIKTKEGYQLIEMDKIEYLQSDNNYTIIHLSDGHKHVMPKTLKEYEISLPRQFFRTHQSYIINVYHIDILKNATNELRTKSGQIVKISRRKKDLFLKFLESRH